MTAIAKVWGVTVQHISQLTNEKPEQYMVEFNPMNPKAVFKFSIPAKTVVREEKVFFEVIE